ncbi:MAG: DUF370 domain-containing protein [Eubacterium sp.]|jgi:regulator of extracellular matrix RemA (YlzA/DUF370 family)|nr:DUF370 domain-containing protein [Eubacterium sp.]
MELLNIGYGNAINKDRIIAAVAAESAPTRRMIAASRERGSMVDASCGKKTKTVFIMDSGHVILSAKDISGIFRKNSNDIHFPAVKNGLDNNEVETDG